MSIVEDVKTINRQYMVVAKHVAASNLDLAISITGLSRDVLIRLAECTQQEIDSICSIGAMYFRPQLSDAVLERALSMHETRSRNNYIAASLVK